MFDSCRKSAGFTFSATVAWLALAFGFSPALLAVSLVWGHGLLLPAITCSALCVALAWVDWTKSPYRCIPYMVAQNVEVK